MQLGFHYRAKQLLKNELTKEFELLKQEITTNKMFSEKEKATRIRLLQKRYHKKFLELKIFNF